MDEVRNIASLRSRLIVLGRKRMEASMDSRYGLYTE